MALIEGKIEIYQCKCNELKIVDTSLFDEGGNNIDNIKIKIEFDKQSYTFSFTEYQNEIILNSEDSIFSNTFKDGIYKITVFYYDDEDELIIKIVEKTFLKCNISCKIDFLISSILEEDCGDCKTNKIENASNSLFKLELLCYAIGCSNYTLANEILKWLEEYLINYNCKNC